MIPALVLAAATSPNVLLVTIDTLRADHVGAYGYAAGDTPVLDRLAREGVLLEEAVVQVPQTRPSHASILTGRYPYEHGLRDNYSPPLDPKVETLATMLRRLGYVTAGFIGAYPVSRPSGLDQGFEVYDDPFGSGESSTTRDPRLERTADQVVSPALAWLEKPRTGPFFTWVHLFDPHAPYDAPGAPGKRFAKNPYDGEIAFADSQVGRLIDWLDRSGTRGRTLVVVTADHGEGLGDHGEDEHMLFLYDSTLHVPAIFSWPGRLPAGLRLAGQFRSIDIVPTVLELLGLASRPTSGASRAEAMLHGTRIPDNESYAESLYGQLHFGWSPLRALRGEGWKLIEAPRAELYRVRDDPGEARNLIETRPPVATGMRSRLASHVARDGPPAAPAAGGVDAAAAERLAALGYVGAGFFAGKPSGADPKDKIGEYQAYRRDTVRALRLFRQRDLDGAIRLLSRLSQAGTADGKDILERRSFNVEYFLGRSLLERARYGEAIPHLESALAMAPTSVPSQVFLAQALGGERRTAEALAVIDKGLSRAPENAELLAARGGLLLRRGDLTGARVALERARERDPSSVSLRVDLATLYRNQGALDLAQSAADEALKLEPKSPQALVERGLVQGARGNEAEAAQMLRRALDASPDNADALFYLAAIELRAGRASSALPLLERLTTVAPEYPEARRALAAARGAAGLRPTGAAPASRPASPATIDRGAVHLRIIRVGTASLAAEAVRRAASGESFEALARALSEEGSAAQGGDLGFVRTADLAEPLRSAAATLAVGETSPVLATPNGYVLLKRER